MLLLALAAALGDATDPALTDLDRRVLDTLSATLDGGPVIVHYDPASVRPADAAAEADRAREALALLEKRLDARLDGPAHLFLYRDGEEFRTRTGAPPAWGAFAAGPRSLHVPRGAPLRHELTHLLARRFPGAADRDPGGLLREGLAVAMQGEDHGVPPSSWAAAYARFGLLPPLASLRERWPEGPPREMHPYNAAGSFVEWLLGAEDLAKVKALYADPGKEREILGRGWEELEAAWRAWLDAREVPDAEEDEIHRGMLLPVGRLPAALARNPGEALFDGRTLAGWKASRAGAWSAAEGVLHGTGGEGWALLDADREWKGAFALRVVARAGAGGGLLLRVNHAEGRSDEALLTPEGCGVTLGGGAGGFARAPVRLVPGRWTEVVLAQEAGTARLYLDGRLVVEAAGAFGPGGGSAGIGATGGAVDVRAAAVLLPGR
jgi:hypothetical protein